MLKSERAEWKNQHYWTKFVVAINQRILLSLQAIKCTLNSTRIRVIQEKDFLLLLRQVRNKVIVLINIHTFYNLYKQKILRWINTSRQISTSENGVITKWVHTSTYKTLQLETNNKILGKKRTNIF